MFETRNPLLRNVEAVAKAMNYDEDPDLMTGSGYYFCWENKNENDVKEIFEKTGIQCSLSKYGVLLVPEYTNFKSEKEKELLLNLSQYGNVMMYLDLCKKCNRKDLSIICKELFNIVRKNSSEEELFKIIEKLISEIS